MSRRGINDETHSIGIGCIDLDVKMARKFGWTEADIIVMWECMSAAYRATSQQVAKRQGHTRQCPDCECWTVPDGPCHLCERDRRESQNQWTCSCGERFSTIEGLNEHTLGVGLLHGDPK